MKWVLEHLQILIVIAGAIAYWLNQRRQSEADKTPPASPREASDAEQQAERTRRVQEEIRRKIAERRGAAAAPAGPSPTVASASPRERIPPLTRPTHVPPLDSFGGPVRRLVVRTEAPPVIAQDDREAKAILERQAKLAQQLRAAEQVRLDEQRRAAELAARTAAMQAAFAQPAAASRASIEFRDQLREPDAIRRAIVLREILGPPLALR